MNPIEKAWEKYHGPIIDEISGEKWTPSATPVYRRGFIDGVDHANRMKRKLAMIKNPDFEDWWSQIGSKSPLKGEDTEEHTKRIAKLAYEAGEQEGASYED